jgi:hypothetical protein
MSWHHLIQDRAIFSLAHLIAFQRGQLYNMA